MLRSPAPLALLLLLLAPALGAGAEPAAAPAAGRVQIRIDSPRPGELVQGRVHVAPIRGAAAAEGDGPADFDVMIAIDVSDSTNSASGADVNGNGVVGVNPRQELLPPGSYPDDVLSTDPGDSVLAAEIAAARALIDGLDARRVRVGILTFAGEMDPQSGERRRPDQQDAWLELPLVGDLDRARSLLPGILSRGTRGATDFAAGIRLAITELAGLGGAQSPGRPGARKVILFLTDGIPTFPIGSGASCDPGDIEASVNAARLAHAAGITINTYAIGPAALTSPVAATEVARVTNGAYTPVRRPGDIIAALQGVSFANIDDVVVTNLTTGDFSTDVQLAPDGSFVGYVPVREGRNHLRVSALSTDGARGAVELDLEFKVAELSDRELARELERVRERNKELQLLLERKRIEDFRAREKQRKELEIQPGATPAGP